jgi:DNA-binding NarL/FixJ family response regulator
VAIILLGDDPVTYAAARHALERARQCLPALGDAGGDVFVLTVLHADPRPIAIQQVKIEDNAKLVVMTQRPSVTQAACALLLGADAYLPMDLDPGQTAKALQRVIKGRLHIEPETAAVLRTLAELAPGLLGRGVGPAATMLALRLRSRGWEWADATDAAGLDVLNTGRALQRLLDNLNPLSRPVEPWRAT